MPQDEPTAMTRADFPVHWPVTTRWSDNDMFGHLNNAVYYELFDTAINGWLHRETGLDPVSADPIGVVAESGCRFVRELAFPAPLDVTLAVTRVGRSSVTYRLGLFAADDADAASTAALGHWVHVYVDAKTRRPAAMDAAVRRAVESATL